MIKVRTLLFYIYLVKMLSSFLDTLLKLSKTTYPQKLFENDCVTLYYYIGDFNAGVLCIVQCWIGNQNQYTGWPFKHSRGSLYKVTLVYATVQFIQHWTSHVLQGTRTTLPCLIGHHVYWFLFMVLVPVYIQNVFLICFYMLFQETRIVFFLPERRTAVWTVYRG